MSEPLATVRFEYGLDDLVDATVRIMRHNKTTRRWRWQNLAWMMALAGGFFYALSSGTPSQRFGALIFGFALAALSNHLTYAKTIRKRIRKLCEPQFPSGDKAVCEVDLLESGVRCRQKNSESTLPWKAIEAVEDSEDALEIYGNGMLGVIIRKRAFADAGEALRFKIELMKRVPVFKAPN